MTVSDVNRLLYAEIDAFPQHPSARRWWEGVLNGERQVGIAPVALFGFLRIATNRRVLTDPLPVDDAIERVRRRLLATRRIRRRSSRALLVVRIPPRDQWRAQGLARMAPARPRREGRVCCEGGAATRYIPDMEDGPDILDICDPETAHWYGLSPEQRWVESGRLWDAYLVFGGCLEPEPDSQSPFFDPDTWRPGPGDRRTGVHPLRGGGV